MYVLFIVAKFFGPDNGKDLYRDKYFSFCALKPGGTVLKISYFGEELLVIWRFGEESTKISL